MVAAAIGASAAASVVGSGISAMGAESAASTQASASKTAAELDYQRYLDTVSNLQPYNTYGQAQLSTLSGYPTTTQGLLTSDINNAQNAIPSIPNQATLLNMPGYQFNLDQGLKSTQAQETAQGKGLSGAATKAASTFSTGLANTYLSNYFNMANTQYQDYSQQVANQINASNAIYNQMYNIANLGEAAAAQTGTTGAQLATAQGNAIQSAGQAQAAGTSTAASSINSGLTGASNNYLTYALLSKNGLLGSGNSGSGAVGGGDTWGSSGATGTGIIGQNTLELSSS